jgi:hypothetical protein
MKKSEALIYRPNTEYDGKMWILVVQLTLQNVSIMLASLLMFYSLQPRQVTQLVSVREEVSSPKHFWSFSERSLWIPSPT